MLSVVLSTVYELCARRATALRPGPDRTACDASPCVVLRAPRLLSTPPTKQQWPMLFIVFFFVVVIFFPSEPPKVNPEFSAPPCSAEIWTDVDRLRRTQRTDRSLQDRKKRSTRLWTCKRRRRGRVTAATNGIAASRELRGRRRGRNLNELRLWLGRGIQEGRERPAPLSLSRGPLRHHLP